MCQKITNIANYCKNFDVKQIIISGLIITGWLNTSFIYQINNSVKALYQKHGYNFIFNSNGSSENLWQDRLHLNNPGKGLLLNNYVITLNDRYFLGLSFTQ